MTSVGKILVLLIMAFSLVFLTLSTAVFVSSKNWMVATRKEHDNVEKLKKKVTEIQAQADASKKGLEDAKQSCDEQLKQLANQVASRDEENKRNSEELTKVRGQLVTASQTAKSSLEEVEAKRQETLLLRSQKSAVEKQANEYKLQQAELNDKIRELERSFETASKNNSDLRERVAKFSTLLRNNGLSDDISQIKGLESPPPVVGEVKRVDPSNRRIEITIGSDDGLVADHELFLYRTSPRPEYLGRIKIVSVDPDQAVGKVIGNTYQGKKIKEGDIVSSTIKPRF
jgi:chromosome segregation ATPase